MKMLKQKIQTNNPLKWLFIPVEVKPREFESRLLLSFFAAETGFGVIFGKRSILEKNLDQLPRGIFFEKSLTPASLLKRVQEKVQQGHLVTCLDEEGVAFDFGNFYVKGRLSDEVLSYTSTLFTWGDREAECYKATFSKVDQKIAVSGNPRMDLYRRELRSLYQEKATEFQNRYGNYVLLPSNFSAVTNVNGPKFVIEQAEKYHFLETSEDRQFLTDHLDYIQHNFSKFLEMIPILAEYLKSRHHTLIIRPNPADDHRIWKNLSITVPNLKVVYEGNIAPWILGATALIHHGCTTGIEAYLLERPAIAYLPVQDARFDKYFANHLSYKAFTINTLLEQVNAALQGNYKPPVEANQVAHRNLASLENTFACERIVEAFKQLSMSQAKLCYLSSPQWQKSFSNFFNTLKENLLPSTFRVRLKKLWNKNYVHQNKQYTQQKFPFTELDELKYFQQKTSKLLNRFYNIESYQLDENLFCVVPGNCKVSK